MAYSDNPILDFELHDAQQSRRLQMRPVCANCDEHIQDDYFYLINGEAICQNCLDADYRKETDNYTF